MSRPSPAMMGRGTSLTISVREPKDIAAVQTQWSRSTKLIKRAGGAMPCYAALNVRFWDRRGAHDKEQELSFGGAQTGSYKGSVPSFAIQRAAYAAAHPTQVGRIGSRFEITCGVALQAELL